MVGLQDVSASAVMVSLGIREGSEKCIKLPKVTPEQSQNLNVGLSGSGFPSPMVRTRIWSSEKEALWGCLGRRRQG